MALPSSAAAQLDRPSFAKVAAAGLKMSAERVSSQIDPRGRSAAVTSSRQSPPLPPSASRSVQEVSSLKQPTSVPLASSNVKESGSVGSIGPEVHVHTAESSAPPGSPSRVSEGMLAAAMAEETGTQVSSSIDFAKPASLDGKSCASGTTFTLDEKESLRPDDSASVMAREDDDIPVRHAAGLPEANTGSDDERLAFCDQLREISDMDTSRQPMHAHGFSHNGGLIQGTLYVPPQGPGVGNVPGAPHMIPNAVHETPPDTKLLEALESPKDRIMVLKLEQDIVDFVKDPKESSLKLPQTNAFYRMLAHKLADYYMLGHAVDESTMAVRIYKTPNCRIPPPLTGIATPSTAASTPPPNGPQMKILRRGIDSTGPTIANGSSFTSKTTSENGESGNEDERRSRVPQSREEREARYEAARKRIMGSEIPSASPEEPSDINHSRSSSAAGRRGTRRKQRTDSDDDFEARSAYSAYYPTAMAQSVSASGLYALPGAHPSAAQSSPSPYSGAGHVDAYQQYNGQPNHPWPHPTGSAQNGVASWSQIQQPGYDLSAEFHRTMSFHSQGGVTQNPGGPQLQYGAPFNRQITGPPQQQWPQQNAYMPKYPPQPATNYPQGYVNHALQHSRISSPEDRPYAYGQLPSQTFPGRPPSKLEHPLPGSYKGKHFNPQSQSFIPAQVNGTNAMPFHNASPQIVSYNAGFNMPSPSQQHDSALLQSPTAFTPVQSTGSPAIPGLAPRQPMTHPLPQPVFPRQPSPNMPLPAKPAATPPRSLDRSNIGPAIVSSSSSSSVNPSTQNSSIAKWGAPASLPAKPPPPSDSFDAAKFAQQSQHQTVAAALSARPTNGLPTFGSMPPVSGGYGMNGGQSRRT